MPFKVNHPEYIPIKENFQFPILGISDSDRIAHLLQTLYQVCSRASYIH
jgi:hypothetical protein